MAEVRIRRPDDWVVASFLGPRPSRSYANISPRARGSGAGVTSADLDELHTKLLEK
jgi:hypothetical protein